MSMQSLSLSSRSTPSPRTSRHTRLRWLVPLCAAVLLVGGDFGSPAPARAAADTSAASASATLARAADLCARTARRAGFSKTGTLVTAVAVALAESHCSTKAVNRNGRTRGCPRGSIDRGVWQINDCHHPKVSARCAHTAQCSANAAYRISSHGKTFRPWVAYRNGRYRSYLAEARAAVGRLG
jgi:Lysozyme like domain